MYKAELETTLIPLYTTGYVIHYFDFEDLQPEHPSQPEHPLHPRHHLGVGVNCSSLLLDTKKSSLNMVIASFHFINQD